jgi:hypothetical protein
MLASRNTLLSALGLSLIVCTTGFAQYIIQDFENFSVGQVITEHLDNVTVSAHPGSCGGPGSVDLIIVEPTHGTSSGTKALGIATGCPDFSPDFIRLDFDFPQRVVTFRLGEQLSGGVTFYVRAYNESGTLVNSRIITSIEGVYQLVTVGSHAGPARYARIEIETPSQLFETIDDLSYGYDPTPPMVRIDSPIYETCACGEILLTGIACEEDGAYDRDRLEYLAVNADPTDPWILIREYVGSPVCEPGSLYSWTPGDVDDGWYYLRVTALNGYGNTAVAFTTVHIDSQFETVDVQSHISGDTICGKTTFAGTIDDACGACFSHYTVMYAPIGTASFQPIDPGQPQYTTRVVNGNLATWNTANVADGNYTIRFTGVDTCENSDGVDLILTVDNASGCGCPGDVVENGAVDVIDFFYILQHWGSCPDTWKPVGN